MTLNMPGSDSYYNEVGRETARRLEREDANYLLTVDYAEYLEYLIDQASWQELTWDESEMTVEPIPGGESVRLRIPFSAHPQRSEYFRRRPREVRLSGEPGWQFDGNTLISVVNPTQEAIQRRLDDIDYWIGGRNRDIASGNARLRATIEPIWKNKREELERRHRKSEDAIRVLNIPLYKDPNAKAKPVEIKPRQLRTVMERPTAQEPELPTLQRDDVVGLVSFIEQYARQFEVSPGTYAKFAEEGLRDLLVGMMNTNYPGSTTAESFNKLGKVDITLRVDHGNVLIAECKFWGGQEEYLKAIHQLFGYLSWRQNFGILITFCTRRDMTAVISRAKQAVEGEPSFTPNSMRTVHDSRFLSRHLHPQDPVRAVELHHLFFDLSVS